MTRKWKNRFSIMISIKLFLIDEIHVLGESSRGAVIEAVVSRMKTYTFSHLAEHSDSQQAAENAASLRFVAISATIPNIEDFAAWLSSDSDHKTPAIHYKLSETYRPVKLEKVVYGYHVPPSQSDYLFDISLSYKLAVVIGNHSNSKPTLVFCSTRKSTQHSAQILAKENKYVKSVEHKNILASVCSQLKDSKLSELIVKNGIGYHHAGLDTSDRHLVENLFLNGHLPVLSNTKKKSGLLSGL